MKKLELHYDRKKFWENYWKEFQVDQEEFKDLEMYPIAMSLKYCRPNDRILECGFGAGRVVRHLHKFGFNVEGIENDRSIVDLVKTTDPRLKVEFGDICKMNYPAGTFDVALCFGVIGGLNEKTDPALHELTRVVKPGGYIVVSVMLDNWARRLQKLLNQFSKEPLEFYAWMNSPSDWAHYFSIQNLKVIDRAEIISRYNVYYWTRWLRSAFSNTNLSDARIQDDQYKLNFVGLCFWFLHKFFLRQQLAAGMTFTLQKPL